MLDIARGEGAVVRRGLLKIAIYCDDQEVCRERSAICRQPGLHRPLEPGRENVGLPVSRIAIRRARASRQWSPQFFARRGRKSKPGGIAAIS